MSKGRTKRSRKVSFILHVFLRLFVCVQDRIVSIAFSSLPYVDQVIGLGSQPLLSLIQILHPQAGSKPSSSEYNLQGQPRLARVQCRFPYTPQRAACGAACCTDSPIPCRP